MTLYEIPQEYIELSDKMNRGVISSDEYYECLEHLNEALEKKISGYLKVYDEKQACLNEITEEFNRLKTRKKEYEDNLSNMKDGLLKVMLAMNVDSMELPLHTLTIASTKGKVVIDSDKDIPKEFIKTTLKEEINKTKLNDYLRKNGDQLYAHLESSKTIKMS